MERLTRPELRAIWDFLDGLYACRDVAGWVAYTLRRLPTLVPSDITSCSEITPARRTSRTSGEPARVFTVERARVFDRLMEEDPVLAHQLRAGDGRAFKTSDFLTRSQLHRSRLYNELYRAMGCEEQMGILLTVRAPTVVGVTVRRGRPGFRERDRLVLNLLRPHLLQAYANAEARRLLTQAVTDGSGVALLTSWRRAQEIDATARQLVARYFDPVGPDNRLPDDLARWVRSQRVTRDGQDDVPPPLRRLAIEGTGRRLIVQLLPGLVQSALLVSEERTAADPAALRSLGLSRREGEVLFWIAQGKANEDIAGIVHASRRTVEKHIEHILERLGVENRTAAAARALERLATGPVVPGSQPAGDAWAVQSGPTSAVEP